MHRNYAVSVSTTTNNEPMSWRLKVDNRHPIHYLVRRGPDIVKDELSSYDVVDMDATDGDTNTPLHLAVERGYEKWVEYLLSKKPNIDVRNSFGLTPLMLAVRHEHPRLVFMLLCNGANQHLTNKEGQTALHYAAATGIRESADHLIKCKAKINHQDQTGNTPLILACKMRNWNIVYSLLHYKSVARVNCNIADHHGRSPLHWAAEVGDAQIVQELINANAEIDAKDIDQETPFVRSIKQNRLDVMDVLIDRGCDRSDIDGLNGTAMTMACILGRYHIMQRLIDVGEDVNEVGHIGFTPLAAAVFECHVESVKVLLDNGADPNLIARMGCNPLVEACKYLKDCRVVKRHEIVKLLLRANADPNQRITMAGYFTACTNGRNCALSYAITTGYCSMAKLMLLGGAKVTPNEITEWMHMNEVDNRHDSLLILKYIYHLVKDPDSLKVQSRRVIRKCLGFMIHTKIHLLPPLPQVLTSYINFEELDWVEPSEAPSIQTELSGELPGLPCQLPCGLRTLQGSLAYEEA